MPEQAAKWGNCAQNDGNADDTIRIAVQIPTSTAPNTTFTVTDTLGSESQRFSCVEDDLNWRYYTSLRPDGNLADGDSTYDTLSKTDTDGNDAEAVDLTSTEGATQLIFTITNTGSERLRDVTVTDEITKGAGTVSNLDCDFSQADPQAPTSGTTWEGPFLVDAGFPCTADLAGVTDEIHEDVASVDATGWFTGTPVHADNPYHATSTPPVTPEPTPSAPAPSQSTTPRKNTRGLPRTGVDGTSGLAAALALAAGLGAVVSHRRRR